MVTFVKYDVIAKEDDVRMYRLLENVFSDKSRKYRHVLLYKGLYLKNMSKGYWYSLDLDGGQLRRVKLSGLVKALEKTLL